MFPDSRTLSAVGQHTLYLITGFRKSQGEGHSHTQGPPPFQEHCNGKEKWEMWCLFRRCKRKSKAGGFGSRMNTYSACLSPCTSRKSIRPKLQRSQPTPLGCHSPWDQCLKPSQEWSETSDCQGKGFGSPVYEKWIPRAIQGQSTLHLPLRLGKLQPPLLNPACYPGPNTPGGGGICKKIYMCVWPQNMWYFFTRLC